MSQEWLDALAHLGTDWHKPHLEDAPFLIVVFLQAMDCARTAARSSTITRRNRSASLVGMLLCSLHLAGLATLTHTPSPMAFLSRILERPENERAYVVIPVGYPAEDAQVPVITKRPLADVLIHFEAKRESLSCPD